MWVVLQYDFQYNLCLASKKMMYFGLLCCCTVLICHQCAVSPDPQ